MRKTKGMKYFSKEQNTINNSMKSNVDNINTYHMVKNFDGGKYWWIFINLSTFFPSKFYANNLLPFACLPDHFQFLRRALLLVYAPIQFFSLHAIIYIYMVSLGNFYNTCVSVIINLISAQYLLIIGCRTEISQFPVTSYLFQWLCNTNQHLQPIFA